MKNEKWKKDSVQNQQNNTDPGVEPTYPAPGRPTRASTVHQSNRESM